MVFPYSGPNEVPKTPNPIPKCSGRGPKDRRAANKKINYTSKHLKALV